MSKSWSDELCKVLISIWIKANIQQVLDGAVRNEAVYERITKCLVNAGYQKDSQQCEYI